MPDQDGANWEIVTPVTLNLHLEESGRFLISDEDFALEGAGPTPIEAVRRYATALLAYYQDVEARAAHSAAWLAELNHLRRHLRRVGVTL